MPLLAENGAPATDIVPPDGMRDRFLSRIASEDLVNEINGGPRLHPFLLKNVPSSTFAREKGVEQASRVEPVPSWPKSRLFWLLSRYATVMATCVVVGTAAFYAGMWKGKHTPHQQAQVQAPRTEASGRNSVMGNSERLSQLEGQK